MGRGDRAQASHPHASPANRSGIARDCLSAAIGVIAIALVFLATVEILRWNSTIDNLLGKGHAEFDLWLVMVGGLAALAAGACGLAVTWSREVVRLCGLDWRVWAGWAFTSAVVLGLVVVCLTVAGGLAERHDLASEVTDATFPVILVISLFVIPGLAYFGLLRSAAQLHPAAPPSAADATWLFDLRRRLQTITTVLGVLLTFIVVTTGVRGTALLAINEEQLADDELEGVEVLAIPIEQVLMYGVLFAFLLGAFYSCRPARSGDGRGA